LNKGFITKTTGSWHTVNSHGELINCKLKGSFRMQGIRNTNPVAVGDEVIFVRTAPHEGIIENIRERKNYIIRRSTNLAKETHILASNIDQVLLMITLESPETPLEFIDRFLVSVEPYHIPAIVLINKMDLYGPEKLARCTEIRSIYEFAGYAVIEISVTRSVNLSTLDPILAGKITAIAGNSGVGKTTLVNHLCPGLHQKTAEVSSFHLTGKHTTTYPEMFPLPAGGFIIDTPGIRGFGVTGIEKNEVGLYFTDIFKLSKDCRFYNCTHLHEPHCAVIEACRKGILSESRYRSYFKIMTGTGDRYRIA
jgi:ribosome biogenesis GTPase